MKNAIAKAIYDELIGNVPLMTALGGVAGNGFKIYHVIARQDAVFPYVTFGILTAVPDGTFTDPRAIDDTRWWFNIFSNVGSKEAGEIVDLVNDVLQLASLTVTGYTNMVCVYDFTGIDFFNIETKIFQIPLRYKIQVDKN